MSQIFAEMIFSVFVAIMWVYQDPDSVECDACHSLSENYLNCVGFGDDV